MRLCGAVAERENEIVVCGTTAEGFVEKLGLMIKSCINAIHLGE